MMVLITYDVATVTPAGQKRLRKVAKQCQNYGQRVQNSVFECVIDSARMKLLRAELEKLIDPKTDSLRFYYLGDERNHRVDHVGANPSLDLDGTLLA